MKKQFLKASLQPVGDSLIQAVLFDYDGVLVNSMAFHVKAWQAVFSDYNIPVKPEDILLTEGSRSFELALKIFEDWKYDISQDQLIDFIQKKQQYYQKITEAKLQPGAELLIQRLKQQGIKIGLVTGSNRKNVEVVLNPEIISEFDVTVTGDEVREGKPNPEAYLKAARVINVEPGHCLVIENAPLGIEAAKSAGMKVVALTTTLDRRYLKDADFIANDLMEVSNHWEEYLNKNASLVR
jgi:beta-phosphoglucomutase